MNILRKSKNDVQENSIENTELLQLRRENEIYKSAISEIEQVAGAVATGNLSARIINWDKIDETTPAFIAINKSFDIMDAFIRESAAALECAARGEYHRKFIERGMPGDFKRGAQIINAAQQNMHDSEASRKTEMLDLANNLENEVKSAINFVEQRGEAMRSKSDIMSKDLEQVEEHARSVVDISDNATRNVESCAAAIEQMSASAQEIQRQVNSSSESMAKTDDEIAKTRTVVTDLASAAEEIGDIAGIIKDIASRTNLLALNATIEAARAGEFGKGFAVVASEVKNLATQTGEATERVDRQIATIQEMAVDTTNAVENIGEVINVAGQISQSVASAAEEQLAATREISQNMHEAAQATRSASNSVSEMATQASETTETAKQVAEEVSEVHDATQALSGKVNAIMQNLRDANAIERRQSERFYEITNPDCKIKFGAEIIPGKIQNVSNSGVAICIDGKLNREDKVIFIADDSGSEISSTVIDCLDNLLRLKFDKSNQKVVEHTVAP